MLRMAEGLAFSLFCCALATAPALLMTAQWGVASVVIVVAVAAFLSRDALRDRRLGRQAIEALSEQASQIQTLENKLVLTRAEADGAASLLLDVQQDCVTANRALTASQDRVTAMQSLLGDIADGLDDMLRRMGEGDPDAQFPNDDLWMREMVRRARAGAETGKGSHESI